MKMNRLVWAVLLLLYCATVRAEIDVSGAEGQNPTDADNDGLPQENIEEIVREVILQLRNESNLKIPGVEIPDPMPIPPSNTTIKDGGTKADLQTWDSHVKGLSQFTLDEVSANLDEMNVSIGLNLSTIMVEGQYNLKGVYFYYLKLTGSGDYWMKLFEPYVSGSLRLKLNPDGFLQVENIDLSFDVQDIQLYFGNLLGQGSVSNFSNSIVNAFSRLIFENTKPYILDELQGTMESVMNDKFRTLRPQPALSKTKSPLDVAIANSATQIREHGYDPYKVPDHTQSFKGKLLFFRFSGNISLYDGYMNGLSTIHRAGPIRMTFKENVFEADAQLGFESLEGGYKWNATFMRISRRGGTHFLIKGLNLLLRVTQQNQLDSHPQIDELKIVTLDKLALDMDGLGSFDFLIEFFTNFFTNVFKKEFALLSGTNLKKIIQKNLNTVKFPF